MTVWPMKKRHWGCCCDTTAARCCLKGVSAAFQCHAGPPCGMASVIDPFGAVPPPSNWCPPGAPRDRPTASSEDRPFSQHGSPQWDTWSECAGRAGKSSPNPSTPGASHHLPRHMRVPTAASAPRQHLVLHQPTAVWCKPLCFLQWREGGNREAGQGAPGVPARLHSQGTERHTEGSRHAGAV